MQIQLRVWETRGNRCRRNSEPLPVVETIYVVYVREHSPDGLFVGVSMDCGVDSSKLICEKLNSRARSVPKANLTAIS
jgi:hypothetical protein